MSFLLIQNQFLCMKLSTFFYMAQYEAISIIFSIMNIFKNMVYKSPL